MPHLSWCRFKRHHNNETVLSDQLTTSLNCSSRHQKRLYSSLYPARLTDGPRSDKRCPVASFILGSYEHSSLDGDEMCHSVYLGNSRSGTNMLAVCWCLFDIPRTPVGYGLRQAGANDTHYVDDTPIFWRLGPCYSVPWKSTKSRTSESYCRLDESYVIHTWFTRQTLVTPS